ncbi:putative YbeD-like domain superfamily protein [Helianthus annuus]|nr:putative YbeD-like domain superfamily protein [Helianthus annuus]
MVFGSTVIDGSTGEWLTLNEKINTYPSARRFTAIGLGGDDFVRSMVVAMESVIQHPVPQGHVKRRVSSGGKYVSVNIGPIRVVSKEQVIFLSVDLFNKSNV